MAMKRRTAPRQSKSSKRGGEVAYWVQWLGVADHTDLPRPILEACWSGKGRLVEDARTALRAKEEIVGKVNRRAFMSEYVERHLRGVVD